MNSFTMIFIGLFAFVMIVILLIDGYAKHMGNPSKTNWWVVFVASSCIALLGSLILQGIISLFL